MNLSAEDAKRNRTFWRGMYLIAFTLGVVLPIAAIIAVGTLSVDILARGRYDRSVDPAFLFFAWSAMPGLAILGMSVAVWIIVATAERLGIDSSRSYLRGMFLMAFAVGAVVPVAAVIAAGVTSYSTTIDWGVEMGGWFPVIMWCGVIAVCLAGLFSAAWLVKSSVVRLASHARSGPSTEIYEPHYINPTEAAG